MVSGAMCAEGALSPVALRLAFTSLMLCPKFWKLQSSSTSV